MIITKMALPRRTFLRGLGATLALPLLDAMVPALSATAEKRREAGLPAGIHLRAQRRGDERQLELLDAERVGHRVRVLADPRAARAAPRSADDRQRPGAEAGRVAGRRQRRAHARLRDLARTACIRRRPKASDIRLATTADQIAARAARARTPCCRRWRSIASEIDLVLGGQCEAGYSCAYMNTLSWQSPTTPLPVENNPSVVFERLFGEGGTPEERLDRMKQKRSLLDRVNSDLARLQRTLGPATARGSRSTSTRCAKSSGAFRRPKSRTATRRLPVPDRPIGIPARFDDHLKLLFDLQWLAYQGDLTRVFTLMYGRELNSRSYPEIGISEPHHGLSHHGDKPEQIEKFSRLNTYQVELFAYFLDKLRSTPDGDGNLLDHTHPSVWRRDEQSERPPAREPAAGGRGRRRGQSRRAAATSRSTRRQRADDEPARSAARQGGRDGRAARRQHRPDRSGYVGGDVTWPEARSQKPSSLRCWPLVVARGGLLSIGAAVRRRWSRP